jgi:hypothetical protein
VTVAVDTELFLAKWLISTLVWAVAVGLLAAAGEAPVPMADNFNMGVGWSGSGWPAVTGSIQRTTSPLE